MSSDIKKIRESFQLIHRVATRQESRVYMSIPADRDRDADLIVADAIDELDKLRAFKAYVHRRLDEAGVPTDPQPERNAQTGCRIEGRLDFLRNRIAKLEEEVVANREAKVFYRELWVESGASSLYGFHDRCLKCGAVFGTPCLQRMHE